MRILLTKKADGATVLKCVRADGSETWQKNDRHAAFFALHDLTHYAVETELGIADGFFGVVASGWAIDDTGQRGVATRLPANALFVEHVVGTLDTERASGTRWTAEEFNESLALKARKDGRPAPRVLTDDELRRVRKRRAELFDGWHALAPESTLELPFAIEKNN
jgi:hypothetical protein